MVLSDGWELPVVVGHESRSGFSVATLGPRPVDRNRVSPTYRGRVRYAIRYLERYPHLATAPVGHVRPESLDRDAVFNRTFAYVPFTGPLERGWAAWFFESKALRDAFVRRFSKARTVPDLSYITRLVTQKDDIARDQLAEEARILGVNLA